MSRYEYTFRKGNEIEGIKATGYNLQNAAENAGLIILRMDRMSNHYLATTKFEDRIRTIWATKQIQQGSIGNVYKVSQKIL